MDFLDRIRNALACNQSAISAVQQPVNVIRKNIMADIGAINSAKSYEQLEFQRIIGEMKAYILKEMGYSTLQDLASRGGIAALDKLDKWLSRISEGSAGLPGAVPFAMWLKDVLDKIGKGKMALDLICIGMQPGVVGDGDLIYENLRRMQSTYHKALEADQAQKANMTSEERFRFLKRLRMLKEKIKNEQNFIAQIEQGL